MKCHSNQHKSQHEARLEQAPDYPATKRLYDLASNLKTAGTHLENRKFKIVSASGPATPTTR